MKPYRLAVFATHPIQYQAPWFQAMAADSRLDLHVFYGHRATPAEQGAAGFGVNFEWDLPLLDGYEYSFLTNISQRPGTATFGGIDTPDIANILASGHSKQGQHFDAVLVNGWRHKGCWQAIRACWRKKIPVLVRSDSHLHTPRTGVKTAFKALPYRWFVPRLDACLAVGTWSREYFLHYGARRERIFLVPHVVNEEWFSSEAARLQPQREELRKQWNLTPGVTTFLLAAKLIAKKRVPDFVKAVGLAARRQPVQGLIIGDGPLRSQLEGQVKAENLPVILGGFLNQSEITKAYIAADVLVLPSDGRETWGLVVNEAMWCGRPCMVSDQVGCGPDLILPGKTGEVFKLGDAAALANCVVNLAADPGLLKQMGFNCRELMRHWSVRQAVEGTIQALQKVCEETSSK